MQNFFEHLFIEHLRWLLLYSIRTSLILAMRILILIQEDLMWLQLIYFLHSISFWFVECLFPIDGTLTFTTQSVTEFTLCFLYHLSQQLWKIHGIASIIFNCFRSGKSNNFAQNRKWVLDREPKNNQVRPKTREVVPETPDPKIFKWDPGPLIFYSFHCLFFTLLDLNTLYFTCYKTLD